MRAYLLLSIRCCFVANCLRADLLGDLVGVVLVRDLELLDESNVLLLSLLLGQALVDLGLPGLSLRLLL